MSLLGADREAEFAALLDLTVGSQRAATALADRANDPALTELAVLADALRSTVSVAMAPSADPAFRDALRQRLVAVATVQVAVPSTATRTPARELSATIGRAKARLQPKVQQRLAAVVGGVAIMTSVAGVGVASAHSLPGDPFYGVKRATESVQLWTARGNEAKGKRHLEFARTRLAEAQQLSPTSSHLASTLAAMNDQTSQGTSELITAYQDSGSASTAPLKTIATFTQEQQTGLAKLGSNLPPAALTQEQAAVNALDGVVKQVRTVAPGLCLTCLLPNGGGVSSLLGPGPQATATSSPGSSPAATPGGVTKTRRPNRGRPTPVTSPSSAGTSPAATRPTPSPSSASTPTPIGSIPPLPIISTLLPPKSSGSPAPTATPTPILSVLLGPLGL